MDRLSSEETERVLRGKVDQQNMHYRAALLSGELPWQFGKFGFGRARIGKARDKAKVSLGCSKLLPETLGMRAMESVPGQKEEERGKRVQTGLCSAFLKTFLRVSHTGFLLRLH